MDAKITKKRLSRMLSYDWLKIVGTAAAFIIVWSLIFTMTATRVLSSQQFYVCNYVGNASLSNAFYENLNGGLQKGAFTHEVLESGAVDLVTGGDSAYQLLQARTTTDEIDVVFVSQQPDEGTAYKVEGSASESTSENTEEQIAYKYTYLESFVGGYWGKLYQVDKYLEEMGAYVARYTKADGSVDKEKVETDFRARVKRMKDKRYKKEAQIQKGISGEVERIEKYANALEKLQDYLEKGYISLTKTTYTYTYSNEEEMTIEGTYSINLCPNEKLAKLSTLVGYSDKELNEETGEEITVTSAKNMNVCFFDSNGKEEAYRYEGVVYVCNLVDAVLGMKTAA